MLPPAQDPRLRIDADVEPRYDKCSELYIQGVQFNGNTILPYTDELNFTTRTQFLESELLVNGIPAVDSELPPLIVSPGKQSVEVHAGGIVSRLYMARAGCCYAY